MQGRRAYPVVVLAEALSQVRQPLVEFTGSICDRLGNRNLPQMPEEHPDSRFAPTRCELAHGDRTAGNIFTFVPSKVGANRTGLPIDELPLQSNQGASIKQQHCPCSTRGSPVDCA